MRQVNALYAFNRGVISPLGLARVDQNRVSLAAEEMENFVPRVLGSMALRPGFAYLGNTKSNNAARMIPFVFATGDTALIELTATNMRIWIEDDLLTRPSVSTAVTNGTFSGNITGWTDGSDSGGVAAWDTGDYLKLTSNGTARAIATQTLTIGTSDQNVEHGLKIIIDRGPITLRVGSSSGGDQYVAQTELGEGRHSIAFTPTGASAYIQFQSTTIYKNRVQECTIEPAGVVSIAAPWAAADLGDITFDQSGDTLFVAADGYGQRKIERRGTRPNARSWSVVLFTADDGPFLTENLAPTTLAGSATTGDITVTASVPTFASTHVGAIFSLTASGQTRSVSVTAQNTFSSSITITGTSTARAMGLVITGLTGTGTTITLQQSTDNATFSDYTAYTTDQSTTVNDGLDNQTIYYRIGCKTGGYSSGTVACTLTFTRGTQRGIVRIRAFSSSTSVTAQVLDQLGATTATSTWAEGAWSDYRGFPGSVVFHEGRLWWAGKSRVWGSVSDAFTSYDAETLGDSGPIDRAIGSGPVDTINWLLSLQRMILGTGGSELSVRSSSFDDPLTPTNFNMKSASTQGSASGVQALKVDQSGIFVQRSAIRVYQLEFDVQNYDYNSKDITALVPELCSPGIVRMAVQRQPDTRLHLVRSDGTVVLSVLDKNENVLSWFTITSDGSSGLIEDVCVLPGSNGSTEDQVYYVIKRSVNGSTVRFVEKWAKETECRGGTTNKQADSHIVYSGVATTTVSGLDHLEGEDVIAWGDSTDLSPDVSGVQTTYTVSGGAITLDAAYSNVVVGLPYSGEWKSVKLGHVPAPTQTILNQHKRIGHLGLILAYAHPKGLKFGPDFDNLDDMPEIEQGAPVGSTLRTAYDEETIPFPGVWDTDTRLCLKATAPRPVTVLAATIDMEIS